MNKFIGKCLFSTFTINTTICRIILQLQHRIFNHNLKLDFHFKHPFSTTNKVHLIKKLFNLKMSQDGNFRQHLNKITNQLASIEITFNDEIWALLILSQLSESWKGTVTTISGSAGMWKLKFEDVVSMILTKEIRMQSDTISTSGSTLNVEKRGRNPNRGRGRSQSCDISKNGRSNSNNHIYSQNQNKVKNYWMLELW